MSIIQSLLSSVCVGAALVWGSAAALAADQIRLGHSQGAEENLWLMDTPGGVTPNRGKLYELRFIPFRSASDRFKAFEAGELDCGTGPASSLIFAAANGVKFRVLASISKESARGSLSEFFVLGDSPIRSIQDLKGKIVAVNGYKSALEVYVRAALLKAGLSPDRDVRYTIVGFSQMGEQLRSGKVDLVPLIEPFRSAEAAKGGVRALFNSREGLSFDEDLQSLYCSMELLRKSPEAVRAFLVDFVATTKAYLADIRKAKLALVQARKVRIDAESYTKFADFYRDPDARLNPEDWAKLQDAIIRVGFMPANLRIDTSSLIDQSFLPPPRK